MTLVICPKTMKGIRYKGWIISSYINPEESRIAPHWIIKREDPDSDPHGELTFTTSSVAEAITEIQQWEIINDESAA